MPAIAKQHIRAEGNSGDIYSSHVKVAVDSKGSFRIEVPPELDGEVRRKNPHPSDCAGRAIFCDYKRGGGGLVIQCVQLEDGLRYLRVAAKRHIEVEVEVARVIGISYTACAAFYIRKDGTLAPNGDGANDEGGFWKPAGPGGRKPEQMAPVRRFILGFAAQVLDRTTYKRASGDVVEWAEAQDKDDASLTRLNSFCRVNVMKNTDDWHDREKHAPPIVIPYTPAAADRLADLMLGLCKMVGQVDAFFADAQALPDKLIAAGPLLLPKGDE